MAYEGLPPRGLEIKTIKQAGCRPGDVIISPDGKEFKIDAIDKEGTFLMEKGTDGKWTAALNDEPQNLDTLFESGWMKKPPEPSATTAAPTKSEEETTEAAVEQISQEINQDTTELQKMQNRLAELQIQMQSMRSKTGFRRFFNRITAAETRLEAEIKALAEQIKNFQTTSQPTEAFTTQEEAFFAQGEAEAEQLMEQIEEMPPIVEVPQERRGWMQRALPFGARLVYGTAILAAVGIFTHESVKTMRMAPDAAAAYAEFAMSRMNISDHNDGVVAQNN